MTSGVSQTGGNSQNPQGNLQHPVNNPTQSVATSNLPNTSGSIQGTTVVSGGPSVTQAGGGSTNQVPTSEVPQVPYKKPFNFIKVGFLIMVLTLLAVGGYVGYKEYGLRQASQSEPESVTPTVEPTLATVETPANQAPVGENTTSKTTNENDPFSETVDFENCSPGDGYSRLIEKGSTYLSIVDVDVVNNICKVELLNESGSGYTKYSCSIPRSIGIIKFSVNELGSDFSAILNYCSPIQSTNNT